MTGAVGFAGTLGSSGEDIEGWGLSLAVEGLAAGESYTRQAPATHHGSLPGLSTWLRFERGFGSSHLQQFGMVC